MIMTYKTRLISALFFSLLLGACHTVAVQTPAVEPPPQAQRLKLARAQLKEKKQTAREIPPILGGMVKSDNWIIYRTEQKEEFEGNVSYDNGSYLFKADYALSERAKNRITARGSVYVRQNEQDGSAYEAYAHKVQYNYKTQKGEAYASPDATPVKVIYTDEKQQLTTALADHISFDLDTDTFELSGHVRIERPSKDGTQRISADKVIIRQTDNFIELAGNAALTDERYRLRADTIVYDGANNSVYAKGSRPLMEGTAEQGTFAIIADEAVSDSEGGKVERNGHVQGWLVSPELKKAEKSAPRI